MFLGNLIGGLSIPLINGPCSDKDDLTHVKINLLINSK